MIATLTPDEVLQTIQQGLQSRTPLTNFSDGSTAGALAAVQADMYTRLQTLLVQAANARNIETATGADLDNLARAFGITRRPPTSAGADAGSAQLLVTNTSGTATVSFPSGTAVWSNINPTTRFYVVNGATLAPNSSQAVSLQASQAGQFAQAAAGALTSHNGDPRITVSNFLPIQGGAGFETDEEFRYRISQTLQAAVLGGSTTAQAVENSLRAEPGVLDVILMPEARGPGTIDALIVPDDGTVPDDDYLTSMQELMATVCAAGISVRALPPTQILVDVQVNLSVSGNIATVPQSPVRTLLQTVITNYVNSRQVYVAPQAGRSLIGTASPDDTEVNYVTLLGNILDAARSQLGQSIQNINLTFSTGSGESSLQGNLYPTNGGIFRLRSARINISASSS